MSTTTEANKALVERFLETFSRGDVQGLVAMMTDDATWWVSGKIEGLSGTYNREDFATLLEGAKGAFTDNALKLWPTGMIAEGDKVAVEAESHAPMHNGRVYNLLYHLLITVRDGKVAEVKEYCDTLTMYRTHFE